MLSLEVWEMMPRKKMLDIKGGTPTFVYDTNAMTMDPLGIVSDGQPSAINQSK